MVDNSSTNIIVDKILMGGKEVWPIVEGGKGIGITNGLTAGSFAKEGAVGTFSCVNNDYINENGDAEAIVYKGKTRLEKHEELVAFGIKSAVSQAERAFDVSGGNGRINMNMLWEAAGASRIINGVLEKAKHLISGVTCGAGMPYQLAEICAKYQVYYYPIISSKRAFRALWKRSYYKFKDWLGAVVYECPWTAGGHNGLTRAEDPLVPQDPYLRIVEIRTFMNEMDLQDVPIILAGGVWNLKDFEKYLNNDEVGKIAFQFGTRPLFTKESPISDEWKKKLFTVKELEVSLNQFSPTGFYSSAVNNTFLKNLAERKERQMSFCRMKTVEFTNPIKLGRREVFVSAEDDISAQEYIKNGFDEPMKTPDDTLVFVTKDDRVKIQNNQIDCMGCLSACKFSNWAEHIDGHTTGALPDPRSYCIQKTLQNSFHTSDIDNNLMFAGSSVFKFQLDEWYKNGDFMPSIKQLVERIKIGS